MTTHHLPRSRTVALVAAFCLAVTACGGDDSDGGPGDDATESAGDGGAAGSSDTASLGADDADLDDVPGPQRSAGDIVEFDTAALPTTPLDMSVVAYSERRSEAPSVTPVVDTCSVLSTAEVDAIAAEVEERYGFGSPKSFTATPRGAACDYRSDTHRLTLLVGSSADVPSDPVAKDAFVPLGAGEIATTPWGDDASIVVLSEDSFDLDTPYGALTSVGDFGLRVDNTGGTGVDASATGELFAMLAAAAASNVESAPPPVSESDDAAPEEGDPCSLWTAAELEALLMGTPFGEPAQPDGPNMCSWDGWSSGGASLSLQVFGDDTVYSLDSMEPVGSTGAVYTFTGGGQPVIVNLDDTTQITLRIDMLDGSIPDDAAIALAENLAARFGA